MPTVEFEFASLRYLNLWIESDRRILEMVRSSSRAERLNAISKGANFYKVQRNFRKDYDIGKGLERYGPVRDVLDKVRL